MSKKEKTGLGFESMFKQKSSENLLLKAFEIFLPKRGNKENNEKENNKKENNILKCTCSFVASVLSAFLIGFSSCTVDAMKSIIDTFITVYIGLLGVTFTGYAFFLALINGRLIEILVDTPNAKGEENKFSEMNESFVRLMFLYISFLTLNIVLKILLSPVDNNFKIFDNIMIDNILAAVGILVYTYCSLIAVWHVKSYVYNIFQTFNLHAIEEYIENKKK